MRSSKLTLKLMAMAALSLPIVCVSACSSESESSDSSKTSVAPSESDSGDKEQAAKEMTSAERAAASMERGELAEAIAHFEKALEGDPKNSQLLNDYAWALASYNRDPAKTKAAFDKLKALAPSDIVEADILLLKAIRALGADEGGRNLRLVDGDMKNPRVSGHKGLVYASLRFGYSEAEKYLEHACTDLANNIDAGLALALLYHREGKSSRGLVLLREVIKLDKGESEAQATLAILLAKSDKAAAEKAYELAMKANKYSREFYDSLVMKDHGPSPEPMDRNAKKIIIRAPGLWFRRYVGNRAMLLAEAAELLGNAKDAKEHLTNASLTLAVDSHQLEQSGLSGKYGVSKYRFEFEVDALAPGSSPVSAFEYEGPMEEPEEEQPEEKEVVEEPMD